MANTISGKIFSISPLMQIPSQSGAIFEKQELVLDCTSYNSRTGEPYENFAKFDFFGYGLDELKGLQAGQSVTVSFSVNGRRYTTKDGRTDYFMSLRGYKVEEQRTAVTELPGDYKPRQQPPQPVKPAEGGDDLPF